MIYRLFILFILLTYSAAAQLQTELYRFSREKNGPDGQVYLYTGMRNAAGQEIIPPLYDQIWDFEDDSLTLARKLHWDPFQGAMIFVYQMITRSGFLFYEFPLHLEPVAKSKGILLCLNRKNMLYGYLDRNGNTLIRFRYSDAGVFKNGLAFAEHPGTLRKGYINTSGKWVIQPEFDQAFGFSEGQAVVRKGSKWFYISTSGKLTAISGNYQEIFDLKEGHSVVSIARRDTLLFGFINKNGQEILAPVYEFLDRFERGTAVFQEKGRTGMIDTTGNVLVPALYDELYRFDQRHYLFQLNGLKGLMSLQGKIVIPAKYSSIGYFREGLCAVNRSGKWGFADTSGNETIPCMYAEIEEGFNGGRARVRMGDKWWIASRGDTLGLPDYDEVLPYFGQIAPFRYRQHWGFLNNHGEESIEARYDELIFNKNGLIFARITLPDSTGAWSVISNTGNLLFEARYLDIVRSSEGIAAVKTKDGWGFINASGIPVCSPHYDEVRNFSEGRAAVKENGEWGFISESGTEVIPVYSRMPVFDDSTARTGGDTLRKVRETFPLYKFELGGDFKNNCACVFDLNVQNAISKCINRIGKIHDNQQCEPYIRMADQITEGEFSNPILQVVRLQGAWLEIDQTGTVLR
jgi:hypothetical protein